MNCHNGGNFLKTSVMSIINQKYKNFELIFTITDQQIIASTLSDRLGIKE